MDASDETAARFLKTTQAKRDLCQVKPQSDWPPVAVVVISRVKQITIAKPITGLRKHANRQEYHLGFWIFWTTMDSRE